MDTLYTLIDRTIQEKGYEFHEIHYIDVNFTDEELGEYRFFIDDINESTIELLKKVKYKEKVHDIYQKIVVMMKDKCFFEFGNKQRN